MHLEPSKLPPELTQPGALIAGKYRVESVLAVGGMGVVTAARNEALDQPVVLKLLRQDVAASQEAMARFLQEARTAAKLQSEHVVRVYDVGTIDGGIPYMVMERLRGTDLQHVLDKQGPLPIKEVVDHVLEALVAIAEAHAAGVVHRDLKPSNLFLAERPDGSRHIKVLDFGISKPHGIDARAEGPALTATEQVVGSPGYMSPEQMMRPRDVDGRSDIWSIGVVLYTLVVGEQPFLGETVAAQMANILFQPVPRLRDRRPDAPAALQKVLDTCLDRDQNGRYSHVGHLARALAPMGSDRAKRSVERIEMALSAAGPAGQTLLRNALPKVGDTGAAAVWAASASGRGARGKRVLGYVGFSAVAAFVLVGLWLVLSGGPSGDPAASASAPAASASAPAASAPAPSASASAPASATSLPTAQPQPATKVATSSAPAARPGPAKGTSPAPAGTAGAGAAPVKPVDDEAKLLGDRK